MKENERKCYKCGCSPAQDPNIILHRFPKPGRTNSLRCELWAKYCFRNDSWSSPEFQKKLHSRHLMLCTKHFKRSYFIDDSGNRLVKSAAPDEECDKVQQSSQSSTETEPPSSHSQRVTASDQPSSHSQRVTASDQPSSHSQRVTASDQPSSHSQRVTASDQPSSHSQRVTASDQPSSHSQRVTASDQPSSHSQRVTASDQQSSSQKVNPPINETFTVAVDQSHSSTPASTTNEQAPSPSLQDQQSSSRTAAVNRPHKTSQTERKRVEQIETLTALQRLENIATTINNPGSNEKDKFYNFGQSVAAQLRSLPLNNALDMQSKIQVLLSTERSRLSTSYSQPSTLYSNTSDYSNHSEEIATSSADDRFIDTIPDTQSDTITCERQDGGTKSPI